MKKVTNYVEALEAETGLLKKLKMHFGILSSTVYQQDILSTCHFVQLPFHQLTLSSSFYQQDILSTCHFVQLPFHQLTILLICHIIIFFPIGHFVNWSFCLVPFHQLTFLLTGHIIISLPNRTFYQPAIPSTYCTIDL